MSTKSLKVILKVLFSAGILCFILKELEISSIIRFLSDINPYAFSLTLIIYLVGQYICSIKWGFISKELGFQFSINDYVNFYFTGMFFNLFLPSSVGGDVIKGYYLCKQAIPNKKIKALISVFWDRLTGVVTLILFGLIGIFSLHSLVPFYIRSIIVLMSFIVFISLILLPFFENNNLKEHLNVFVRNLSALNKNAYLWKQVLLYSISFHFLAITIHYILAKCLGLDIPFFYLFIIYPLTSIAGFIPVSLNGIGVREGLYVYLLSLVGINHEEAFAFSVLWFLVMTISSLFSIIFYLKSKNIISQDLQNSGITSGDIY